MHSYDKIESHNPDLPLVQGRQAVIDDVCEEIEDYLVAAGLSEVMTYSFINPNSFDKILLDEADSRRGAIELMNPLSDEFKVMRTSMLPGMLNTAAYNQARQAESVKIFEIGKVFLPKALPLKELPEEKPVLCAVLAGRRSSLNWTETKDEVDFYDMKGAVEGLLENLHIAGAKYVPVAQPYLHPGKSCAVEYEGRVIGWFGELHPTVAGNYGLNGSVCVLELEVEPLVASASHVPQFVHLPKYPQPRAILRLLYRWRLPWKNWRQLSALTRAAC